MSSKKVLILGGGYAGISAVIELSKKSDLDITLVDKHSYHNLQPEIYDFMANKCDAADVTVDLITFCKGLSEKITFLCRRVISVDFTKKIVSTEERDDIAYDYLLICVGSRTFFPRQIEGLDKTDDLKKLHKALKFKQHFESEMFKKMDNEAKKCEELSIVVVGGGLSGVEIAAEMAYYADYFFKKGLFACDYMKIHLISDQSTILPGMDSYLIDVSTNRLKNLNVNIISGKRMVKADRECIYLDDDSSIRYSFCIFAGGIEAANLTNRLTIQKNKKGQIICDEFARVLDVDCVYAAGDCMEVRGEGGEIEPSTVQISMQSAKFAAKNIINEIEERDLVPYRVKNPGVMVALGGKYAVGMVGKSIKLSGFLAYIMKKMIFFKYRYPLTKISKKGYDALKH